MDTLPPTSDQGREASEIAIAADRLNDLSDALVLMKAEWNNLAEQADAMFRQRFPGLQPPHDWVRLEFLLKLESEIADKICETLKKAYKFEGFDAEKLEQIRVHIAAAPLPSAFSIGAQKFLNDLAF